MKLYGGIDIGSTTTELVIINAGKQTVYADKILTSGNIRQAGGTIIQRALKSLDISMDRLEKITATGYGRKQVEFAGKNITEITCYAKGAYHLAPSARTVIDIGGQDSKVITIFGSGDVDEFVMNDKCAAGTGRFLEMIAKLFNLNIAELGEISLKSENIFQISSICAVFAESEVISLISQEVKMEDIINSIHNSVGEKILGMSGRLKVADDILFCGGVARNAGMVRTLKRLFKDGNIIVAPDADFVGALGAALFAAEAG